METDPTHDPDDPTADRLEAIRGHLDDAARIVDAMLEESELTGEDLLDLEVAKSHIVDAQLRVKRYGHAGRHRE